MKDIKLGANKIKQTEKLFSVNRRFDNVSVIKSKNIFKEFIYKNFNRNIFNFSILSKFNFFRKVKLQIFSISFLALMILVNLISVAGMTSIAIQERKYTFKIEKISNEFKTNSYVNDGNISSENSINIEEAKMLKNIDSKSIKHITIFNADYGDISLNK